MTGVELVLAFLAGIAMGIALDRWLLEGRLVVASVEPRWAT